MSIVQLDKVTLFGTLAQKGVVLDGLQRLGCVHLLDLDPARKPEPEAMVSSGAREALTYLRACPIKRNPARRRQGYDLSEVESRALALKRRQEELEDESDHVREAIHDLEPWGDFELPEDGSLAPTRFWFYVRPHRALEALAATDLAWYVAAEDQQFAYVVILSAELPVGLPVPPAELDPRALSRLRARLEEVEEELEELSWERADLTRWRRFLAEDLVEADDRVARRAAARETLDTEHVFAVQGWAPRDARGEIRAFAEQHGLALTVEEPAAEDTPPTLLRNPERLAGGEGAVTFYITPAYRAWDPSLVVFFSFSLFFGMIFSDAGYGLVLLAILLALWRKLGRSRGLVRLRNLLASLVCVTIGYGVVVGSYFGLGPPADSPLASLKLLEVTDRDGMMVLSVVIGVAHLVLANLIAAWGLRRTPRALAALGWAAALAGGLVLGGATTGSLDPARAKPLGMYLLAGGGGAVFLFSSARPLLTLRLRHWLGRILDGLGALTSISKAFGDVLSYLRLFALGLASAQLAVTFNDLASGVASDIRGLGVLLAIVILVVGHGINFLLGIMGGVVHGLRLNCIEFFNWSLQEEGYPFRAYCKKAGL